MPKLPSSADVQTVNPRIGSDPGVSVPSTAFQSGLGIAAEELVPAVDALAKAAQRMEERRALIDEFRVRREAGRQLEQVGESIFADTPNSVGEERLAELGAALTKIQQEAMASHRGTPDTRISLATSLAESSDKIIASVSKENQKRQRAEIDEQLGIEIRSLADRVVRNPNELLEAVRLTEEMVDRTAGVIGADEALKKKRAAASLYTELVIQRILRGPGGPAQAQDVLGVPEVQRLLSDEAFNRLQFNIVNFKDENLETDTVFDITSPTFTRIVTKRESIGQPGPPQRPLVQFGDENPFLKALSGKEAERAVEIMEQAEIGARDLVELNRIDIALESEEFTPGTFGEIRSVLARAAEFFGAPQEIRDRLGDPAVADTLDAASNTLAVSIANNLSRVTNMSLTFIRDSLPNLVRTPEGNKILVEVMRRVAQRKIDIARMQEEFLSENKDLRPEGKPSFFAEVIRFQAENPIVDDALRKRIMEGSKKGAKSETFAQMRERLKKEATTAPKGVTIPEGFEVLKIDKEADTITLRDRNNPKDVRTGPMSAFRKTEE